jgi:hypothetical protein
MTSSMGKCANNRAEPTMLDLMFPAPPMPEFPPGHSTTTTSYLRYEDVTQDGRLIPIATPASLAGLWREVLRNDQVHHKLLKQGVIPIMTRLTLTTLDQSIRVDHPIASTLGFQLAHDVDVSGDVSRLFLNVWSHICGTSGRLGRNPTAGDLALAGTVFAEHTFTRLLAPPDQRKVTKFAVEGVPEVPEQRYAAPAPTTAQDLPEGAKWLDESAPDPAEYVFTLDQTDSNQHVNSLVYIRIFHDAINRRLATTGKSLKMRSREVDIAYRKPSFAGDKARIQLRLFEHEGGLGAAGRVEGADDGKPRCYVRVLLGT